MQLGDCRILYVDNGMEMITSATSMPVPTSSPFQTSQAVSTALIELPPIYRHYGHVHGHPVKDLTTPNSHLPKEISV